MFEKVEPRSEEGEVPPVEAEMTKEPRARLEACLDPLRNVYCFRCLAGNSISLRFGSEDVPESERYIWIEPPWRLMESGRFVMGSQDCPDHEEFESKEDEAEAFNEWAAPFKGLGQVVITGFTLGDPVPDLAITFSSGHVLETFNRSRKDYSWYYREIMSGLVIEAYASGLVVEVGRPGLRLHAADDGDG